MHRFVIKIIFIYFFFCNLNFACQAEIIRPESKITYTLTSLGLHIKKKALPTTVILNLKRINENQYKIEKIKTLTRFTSKNPLFKKVIDYDKYPDFSFESAPQSSINFIPGKSFLLKGFLTFHGVKKDVVIELMPTINNGVLKINGQHCIEMTEFGLVPPRLMFFRIDNKINTDIELYTELP